MTRLLVLAVTLLAVAGCATPVAAPVGDASYRTAVLCTSAELAPVVTDAASRWHAATPLVAMSVKVVAHPEDLDNADPACSANVYADARVATQAHDLGITNPGVIAVTGDETFWSDASDIMTHELGHLLLGDDDKAHSADPASLMYLHSQAGEQDILPSDVAKLH